MLRAPRFTRLLAVMATAILCGTSHGIAHASLDSPDPGFGTAGSSFWGSDDGTATSPHPLVAVTDDRVYVTESTSFQDPSTWKMTEALTVTALNRHGQPAAAFGNQGQIRVPLASGHRAVAAGTRADGGLNVVTIDDNLVRVITITTTGSIGANQPAQHTYGWASARVAYSQPGDVRVLPGGRIAYFVALDEGYALIVTGPDGENLNVAQPLGPWIFPLGLAFNGDTIVAAVTDWTDSTELRELDPQDLTVRQAHAGPDPSENPRLLAVSGSDSYWGLADWSTWPPKRSVLRWRAGAQDQDWRPLNHEYGDPAVHITTGRIIVSGVRSGHLELTGLLPDGTPDPSFGTAGTLRPDQSLPAGYDGRTASPPQPAWDGLLIALSVGPQVTERVIGSSTPSGYTRLWRFGAPTMGPPAPTPSPVDDQPQPVAPMGAAATLPGPAVTREVSSTPRDLPTITGRTCVSRRRFAIRLRKGPGNRDVAIRHVRLLVNGDRVPVTGRERRRGIVNLRGMPKGRFIVRATLRLANDVTVIDTRRYRTCAPKRISSKSKTRKPAPVEVTR